MFLLVVGLLALLSVYNLRKEYLIFSLYLERRLVRHGVLQGLRNAVVAISALPRLAPLLIDIIFTVGVASALGLNAGVMGGAIALVITNAFSMLVLQPEAKRLMSGPR